MYKEEATDSSASYKGVGGTGAGILNYMSYGDFKLDDTGFYKAKNLFPSGIVMGGDLSKVIEVDAQKIAEDVLTLGMRGLESLNTHMRGQPFQNIQV